MLTEEERAAQYRADQASMEQARRARERALAGNKVARQRLDSAWAPVKVEGTP